MKYLRLGGTDIVGAVCLKEDDVSELVGDRFFCDREDD